jgi:hypothetical protein
VMLFEMVAGRPPFVAEGVGELFAKHMLEDPPPVTELAPATPPHMAAAIMKSLAKNADDRFPSMEDLRKALFGEVKLAIPASAGGTGMRRLSHAPTSQTMSPRASTTLSSASSELDESFGAPKSRKKLVVGIGGGLAVAAVAAFLLMPKTPPAPEVKPVAPPPAAVVAPPPGPPVKKTVTIRFESDPAGAHLFSKKDNKDLGVVPVEVQLPKDSGKGDALAYVLRMPGYRELTLVADAHTDRTFHVSLDKLPAAAPPVAEKKARPSKGGGGHTVTRRRNPVDEDGLATPSF